MSAVQTLRQALFGNPPSNNFKPDRNLVIEAISALEAQITEMYGVISTGTVAALVGDRTYATQSALYADLVPADNLFALVYADTDPLKNGLYQKDGATTTGDWDGPFDLFASAAEAAVEPLVEAAVAAEIATFTVIDEGNNVYGFGSSIAGGITTATGLSALGAGAARDITSGSNNSCFGFAAGRATTTGARNVYAGAGAGLLATTASDNVGIGEFALANTASLGSRMVGIGRIALRNATSSEAVAVGDSAGNLLTTGVRFAALGSSAGGGHTTEDGITMIGWGAGLNAGQVFGYGNQTAIGADSYCTWENQVTLGGDDVNELRFFGAPYMREYAFADTIIGRNAGNRSAVSGSGGRVIIGYEAAARPNLATDTLAIYIGYLCGNQALSNRAFVSIGSAASQYAENNVDVTVVGDQAGRWLGRSEPTLFEDAVNDPIHLEAAGEDLTNGLPTPEIMVGHCFFGKNAGRYNTIGQNNTGLGDSALGFTLTGGANVAIGYVCGEGNVHGSRNTWAGQGVRVYQYSGDDNTQIGYAIGEGVGSFGTWLSGGSRNCNVGAQSVHKWRGDDVCSMGYRAFFNMTAGDGGDVGIGTRAGQSVTTGGGNVFIGDESGNNGSQLADVQGSIAIGAGTHTTRDNEIVLGTGSITHVSIAGITFTKAQIEALLALVD